VSSESDSAVFDTNFLFSRGRIFDRTSILATTVIFSDLSISNSTDVLLSWGSWMVCYRALLELTVPRARCTRTSRTTPANSTRSTNVSRVEAGPAPPSGDDVSRLYLWTYTRHDVIVVMTSSLTQSLHFPLLVLWRCGVLACLDEIEAKSSNKN